jgi:predicted ester cyclase
MTELLTDPPAAGPSEQEANKSFIRDFVEQAMNQGHIELADRCFAPDCRVHVPGRPDLPPGPEAFKAVMAMWRGAFADWRMDIDDLVAEGDTVVKRFTTTGTHTGPLLGAAPTGRTFRVEGVVTFRMRGGQVVESWVTDDVPSMLVQLGLLVPAVPAGAPR